MKRTGRPWLLGLPATVAREEEEMGIGKDDSQKVRQKEEDPKTTEGWESGKGIGKGSGKDSGTGQK